MIEVNKPRGAHEIIPQVVADPATLIRSLQQARAYDHAVQAFALIETHISWVILTGRYAYKIKKPVNLGFLDFSTLEQRRHYCREEVRLNRRLAPELYLDAVPITGTATRPVLGGKGTPIEYAVKMVQFPQAAQLDRVLARGELSARHIDELAGTVAAFHARTEVAAADSPWGNPEPLQALVRENFDRVSRTLTDPCDRARLDALRAWSEAEYERGRPVLARRKREGSVRECHGDMHLRNMALIGGKPLIFDCIEFSDEIRWIDVLSEAAFVVMDLDDRGHPELGRRFLNTYLEGTGDYEGLAVLRYYLVYRAMVRAMVDRLRAQQTALRPEQKAELLEDYRGYVTLAARYTQPEPPALLIMHGLSGSGKSTIAQALLMAYPAIRLRSDVERKRLHGLDAHAHTRSAMAAGIYTAEASARTYKRLLALARSLLVAGYPVIVDAAFLKREQRAPFQALAQELRVPLLILDCQAPEELLLARLGQRERAGIDPSEASAEVLRSQLATQEPLAETERSRAIVVQSTEPLQTDALLRTLRERLSA